jgi:predicted DNA-binding ribbon-helix-helix protein
MRYGVHMNRPRVFRIEDRVWEHAERIAKARGTTVSGIVNRYLKALKQTSHLLPTTRRRGKDNVRRRCIKIEDKTWEKVQWMANHYGTTMTDIIVNYLWTLDETSVVKPGHSPRRYAPDGARTNSIRPRTTAEPPTRQDPALCPHLITREVFQRTYCTECGTRLDKEGAR